MEVDKDLEIAKKMLQDLQESYKAKSVLNSAKVDILGDLLKGIESILERYGIINKEIISDIRTLLSNTIFK